MILTLLPVSGGQVPGKLPNSSLPIEKGAGVCEGASPLFSLLLDEAGGIAPEPSMKSIADRRSHPRDRPEILTWIQSGLASSTSNSSSALARNSTLASRLGFSNIGVWSRFTAIRLVGCDWLRRISSRFLASASTAGSAACTLLSLEGSCNPKCLRNG